MISLEKAMKEAMVPSGTARETDLGREVSLFEVEATAVESVFQKFYSYIFYTETVGFELNRDPDRPSSASIFVVNFDKVRMDTRNKEVDLDSFMFSTIDKLSEEDMKKQEGDYIYRGSNSSLVELRQILFEWTICDLFHFSHHEK
ncbi:unnamed protein product [Linum trigynum]|uniref:DUF7906 domain-containing protein n=1 Tax=Linum trigynum TaxID=586398 RepID=A0AAV2ER34_9ROSI